MSWAWAMAEMGAAMVAALAAIALVEGLGRLAGVEVPLLVVAAVGATAGGLVHHLVHRYVARVHGLQARPGGGQGGPRERRDRPGSGDRARPPGVGRHRQR